MGLRGWRLEERPSTSSGLEVEGKQPEVGGQRIEDRRQRTDGRRLGIYQKAVTVALEAQTFIKAMRLVPSQIRR